MKKAIVTGANGFIGSYLVKELLSLGIEVIAVVRNENSNIDKLAKNDKLKIVYCDLNELPSLSQKMNDRDIDVFYHFAWSGPSGNARTDETLQMQNALWTVDTVRIAKELGCKRFVGAGSIMENETMAAVYSQENQPGLAYIYGAGKLTAHCISKAVAAQIGIEHVWGTITNAYGPGELSPRFINTTIRKIINNEPLQFTSAKQNYDFIYITDVAKAFYLIGLQGKPFCNYTIGGSNAKPLREFIIEMAQTLAPEIELTFGDIPFTGINMGLEEFSTADLKRDTGFECTVSFPEGVKRTMEWLKQYRK
ncbi:NAD(P)-dependent oxidoreductase [Neobacillus niacini]|uniref:NAD-dependent epimerase/dehydratase family protein n=1 Tax=Neobacillus niacini TaxID=86668 RepID=UPI0021CB88EB|nr:NAD-dependent epimerase/dehydratase [Neobacillus niacini]MCM3765774.1 NAD-dependent epimerase/dehydratase [Neobacillus niacini]